MTQRHSWVSLDRNAVAAMGGFSKSHSKTKVIQIPPLPDQFVPAEGQKLFKCKHCHWWRVTARGERGGPDFFYFSSLWERKVPWRWFMYLIAGRPKCGEVK